MKLIFKLNELTTLYPGYGLYVYAYKIIVGIGLEYIPISPAAYSVGLKKL